jgi:hypothetical protein
MLDQRTSGQAPAPTPTPLDLNVLTTMLTATGPWNVDGVHAHLPATCGRVRRADLVRSMRRMTDYGWLSCATGGRLVYGVSDAGRAQLAAAGAR